MTHGQLNSRFLNAAIGVFTITSFTAACLLFLVQPMFAKLILPRLGGSPAVWNTCVLFFQTTLLLGYLYAHLTTKAIGVRRQATWHFVVVLAPLILLPLSVSPTDPGAAQRPISWLLTTMAWTVGMPFFVVSTSAPLLQRWFGALQFTSARDPYFLYAASNLGSMIALLGYPFVLEPFVGLQNQTVVWAAGYAIFVVMIGVCVWLVRTMAPRQGRAAVTDVPDGSIPPPTVRTRLHWIVLALVPSSMMLGVTTYISTDLAAVPLLWVLPLAIYLFTFVLAFTPRQIVTVRSLDMIARLLIVSSLASILVQAWWLMPLHLVTFFCISLACHSRLAEQRPNVVHLTGFYLWLSLGGMLGGVFNSLIAPHLFSTILEYPLVLAIASVLDRSSPSRQDRSMPTALLVGVFVIVSGCVAVWTLGLTTVDVGRAFVAIAIGLATPLIVNRWGWAGPFRVIAFILVGIIADAQLGTTSGRTVLFVGRSFFGVHRIVESSDHTSRILQHGNTVHGWQRLPTDGSCEPSGYYSREGPIGQLFVAADRRFTDVGVVGLGAGGLACYAEAGQRWTFYEIDPLVEQIATNPAYFTHLRNSRGDVKVVIGDGRITLNAAQPGRYDLIILDAFSSDSIPVHLLTREAFRLYLSRLKATGVIAVHVSNRYLRLEPVIGAMAEGEGLHALVNQDLRITAEDRKKGRLPSSWIMLARDRSALVALEGRPGWRSAVVNPAIGYWSDDYSNILQVLAF